MEGGVEWVLPRLCSPVVSAPTGTNISACPINLYISQGRIVDVHLYSLPKQRMPVQLNKVVGSFPSVISQTAVRLYGGELNDLDRFVFLSMV